MASSKRDKALLAEITGVARRLARGQLSGAEQQEAAATLSQVARGRADLLAESAGLAIGAHEGGRDEARYLQAAQPGRVETASRASATAHEASCSLTACHAPAASLRHPARWAVARQAASAVFVPTQP